MAETHGNAGDPLEPKTPMWLPAVGAILFLTVALIWALTPSTTNEAGDSAAPAASAKAGGDVGAAGEH